MEAKKEKRYYTVEEYFELEKKAAHKSEYHDGEIVAMAGGTLNHSRISTNTTRRLSEALSDKDCEVFNSDIKIVIERLNSYLYPDISVVCGDIETPDNQNDRIKNPILIVEVLSASTQNYDRVDKFRKYLTIPSLREYVLIEQDKALVQSFYRNENLNQWEISFVEGLDKLLLFKSLNCTVKMEAIYENVVFEQKEK